MKSKLPFIFCILTILSILITACGPADVSATQTPTTAVGTIESFLETPIAATAVLDTGTEQSSESLQKAEHLGDQGAHAGKACDSCHKTGTKAGTPATCDSCHSEPASHKTKFSLECSVCHTPTGWSPAYFDHNHVSFKLGDAHSNIPCVTCHKNDVYKGTIAVCASCHAEESPHVGRFSTDCTGCHSNRAWIPVNFNHNLSSFILENGHANVPCSTCHVNSVYKGTSSTCSSCHASTSPHSVDFGTNCSECHSTSGWGQARFSHDAIGKQNCMDCHEDDQPDGHFDIECSTCHETGGWENASFNHEFDMDHGGADGECSVCHPSGPPETDCDTCHESEDEDDD